MKVPNFEGEDYKRYIKDFFNGDLKPFVKNQEIKEITKNGIF